MRPSLQRLPRALLALASGLFALGCRGAFAADSPLQISGVYPHLAVFNQHGECGIGAVVPWAGRLWFITYPPHFRSGSSDKLYELSPSLELVERPESVGGTHANRMIHRESKQLIIGPYFIDERGRVRSVDVKSNLVGRMTATARHLTDPTNRVYFLDMEGPVYEVNVRTLDVTRLFVKPVPGWHGKGGYTGQGRFIIANNGEVRTGDLDGSVWEWPESLWPREPEDAGVLAEWDGREWTVIERRQFTEVTGPGGLLGEPNRRAPVWAVGWDRRSVILKVRQDGRWQTFRLPKGSYTYDPLHGWFTEWPRIREIATGRLMMVMHGMMFDFPSEFRPGYARGLRPIASHLRYVPDFCHWDGRVVLASDETSIMQNPMAGTSQSNLRFLRLEELRELGPATGWGGPWVGDYVKGGKPSDPYLLAGFPYRTLHLSQQSDREVIFTIEIDERGTGKWKRHQTVSLPARGYRALVLPPEVQGEWIRLTADSDCLASAYLHYATPPPQPDPGRSRLFDSLVGAQANTAWSGGLVRPADHSRDLQFLGQTVRADGTTNTASYYEVDEQLNFRRLDDPDRVQAMRDAVTVTADFTVDDASVVVRDRTGQRFRLPKGPAGLDQPAPPGMRGLRECVSERFLANFHGTFFEVPRQDSGAALPNFWKMKPVASHPYRITDFCTWRGLLVIAGNRSDATPDDHYFRAPEGDLGLWFGAVDDLWKLGKPVGIGGPWKNTPARANEPSDPYLMANYGRKSVALSHDAVETVTLTLEVDCLAQGIWRVHQSLAVAAGQTRVYPFPLGFGAHWARVRADRDCRATATFSYD